MHLAEAVPLLGFSLGNISQARLFLRTWTIRSTLNTPQTRSPCNSSTLSLDAKWGSMQCKSAKFSNVSSVTLFLPASQGAETSQIYYVGWPMERGEAVKA
ncbi:hypothetical protein EDB86DRAFT_2975072 [Lactarius hatsudake]|nr:hypothetical protein EDB86DRAFT_2975072 [Lactarius hatsudake]